MYGHSWMAKNPKMSECKSKATQAYNLNQKGSLWTPNDTHCKSSSKTIKPTRTSLHRRMKTTLYSKPYAPRRDFKQ